MAKKRLFDLPETKGTFHVIGQATRLASNNSYKAGSTQNGKAYRSINFGVKYAENEAPVSVGFTGYVNNEVYFWSSRDKQTKRVPWKDRNSFSQDGYVMMGKALALTRGADGNAEKAKLYTDYDSADEIYNKLHDDDFVYVAGDLNFRQYKTKENEKRTAISLVPNRVYLQNDKTNWNSISDDKAGCIFKQRFVYQDIEQEKDSNDKPTGRYIVYGIVVGYSSINRISMILTSREVANNVKKKIKPYTAIDVYGLVKMQASEEEVVVEDDGWGDQTFATKITAPTRREFVIVRIDKDSFDSETYTEKNIAEANAAVVANERVEETYNAKETKSDDGWSIDADDSDDWGSDEDLPF